MLPDSISKHIDGIQDIARENNISYLALFGSYARGEQKKGSDIDLLVTFDGKKGLFEVVGIEQQLSAVLGIKVDLITKKGLSKHVKSYVLDDLKVIYAKKS